MYEPVAFLTSGLVVLQSAGLAVVRYQKRQNDEPDAAWALHLPNPQPPYTTPQNPLLPNPTRHKPDATQPAAAKTRNRPQMNPKQSTSMNKLEAVDPEAAEPKVAKPKAAEPKAAAPGAAEDLSWLAWQKGGRWVGEQVQSLLSVNEIGGSKRGLNKKDSNKVLTSVLFFLMFLFH